MKVKNCAEATRYRSIARVRPARLWLAALLVGLAPGLSAQSWTWVSAQEGEGDESVIDLSARGEDVFLAGTFTEPFFLAGADLVPVGQTDIFLARADPQGAILEARAIGGPGNDLPATLLSHSSGALLLAGSFWGELQIGETTLRVDNDQKALFIAAFATVDQLLWARVLSGTGLKEITGLAEAPGGDIVASGYFGGQLFLGEGALTAEGENDLFLVSLSPDGQERTMSRAGYRGDTRAIAVATAPDGDIFVGGYFNDTTILATDTLVANTLDRDVFVARFDASGEALWGRKAGGVHDDDLVDIVLDPDGNLWATGFLVGVMQLSDDLSIQSSTGLSDCFLIGYSAAGEPLAARAFGGPEVQQPGQLAWHQDQLAVLGVFQGTMEIDQATLTAGGGFSSFLAVFQPDLSLSSIIGAQTEDELVLRSAIPIDPHSWMAGGTFRGAFRAGDLQVGPSDTYEMVLSGLSTLPTSLESLPSGANRFVVYPNPADQEVTISCRHHEFQVRVFTLDGKVMGSYRNPTTLSVAGWPAGSYWLQCVEANRQHWRRLIVR